MKLAAVILLTVLSFHCLGQGNSYEMSSAIELPNAGWNKLVQMHNGNTVLFHFENKKNILVKVFDKNRKEIASEEAKSQLVNTNKLDLAYFDGLNDINDEAVLFLTQQFDHKDALIRLQFNSKTGQLSHEENVSESQNFSASSTCFLLKEPTEAGYYVVCFVKGSVADASLMVRMFNEKHELIKDIPLGMVKSGYDNIHLLSQEIDRHGSIMLTVELNKIIRYPDIVDKYVVLYYLPKDAPEFSAKVVHLPRGAKDLDINFTDNEFSDKLNIFLTSLYDAGDKKDVGADYITSLIHMLLISDKEFLDLQQIQLNDQKIKEYITAHLTTPVQFVGNTLNAYTNTTGITTVVNEDIQPYDEQNAATGLVGVTQYGPEGKEKWGTLLTKSKHTQTSFNPAGTEVFHVRTSEYELSQTLCLSTNSDAYIIFNERQDNYDKGLGANYNAITDFHQTNAIYYRVNKKREISKSYLLGSTTPGEYKYIYTYSGGFNEHRSTFATLMQLKKGNSTSMHIAWCHLD